MIGSCFGQCCYCGRVERGRSCGCLLCCRVLYRMDVLMFLLPFRLNPIRVGIVGQSINDIIFILLNPMLRNKARPNRAKPPPLINKRSITLHNTKTSSSATSKGHHQEKSTCSIRSEGQWKFDEKEEARKVISRCKLSDTGRRSCMHAPFVPPNRAPNGGLVADRVESASRRLQLD